MILERIPGFAICAHCGAKQRLRACKGCGLLTCGECGGGEVCVACHRGRLARIDRALRRMRVQQTLQRVAVVACVTLSGLAGVGAALLPESSPALFEDPHMALVAHGEVRFVGDVVQAYSDAHGTTCLPSLGTLRAQGWLLQPATDPWGQALLYGCVESPRAFVVMSKGADREIGTADDLIFTSP